jgi:hypothetical protein
MNVAREALKQAAARAKYRNQQKGQPSTSRGLIHPPPEGPPRQRAGFFTWRALCHSPTTSPFTGTAPPFAEKRFRRRRASVIVSSFHVRQRRTHE